MPRPALLLSLLACAGCTPGVSAQQLETSPSPEVIAGAEGSASWLMLSFNATVQLSTDPAPPADFDLATGHRYGVSGWVRFDPAAPRAGNPPVYPVGDLEMLIVPLGFGDTTVRRYDLDSAVARFRYNSTDLRLTLTVSARDVSQTVFSLVIESPSGPGFGEETLPDNPVAYGLGAFGLQEVSAHVGSVAGGGDAHFAQAGGYDPFGTSVSYIVNPTTPPEPKACSPADIAEPFGVLNLDDIDAFATGFLSGCP